MREPSAGLIAGPGVRAFLFTLGAFRGRVSPAGTLPAIDVPPSSELK